MTVEEAAGKRSYRNPLSDYYDQILFFALFLIGSGGIWLLKLGGFHQLVVTSFPLALMVLYAAIALITKRFRLREDRVGDNIYYLGFLFTLTSLAYALYVYNPDGSGASEIITNFGIAIFTTIFGLAGRVLFNQMRQDPVEYEREARYSLAEASMAMRSELANIATELSSFKRRIVQITEEGVVDVSNTAKASMTSNVKEFSGAAGEVIEKIRAAFAAFTDHSSRLNEIASKNVDALQSLFDRIEKIEASPETLAAKLDPAVKKFEELADEALQQNKNQTKDLKRLRQTIESATTAAETLQNSLSMSDKTVAQKWDTLISASDSMQTTATEFAETLRKTSALLTSNISGDVAAQARTVSEMRAIIESDLEAMRRHRTGIDKMVTESRESLRALQGTLVSLSRAMVEQLGGR
jgi:hypothetical protein